MYRINFFRPFPRPEFAPSFVRRIFACVSRIFDVFIMASPRPWLSTFSASPNVDFSTSTTSIVGRFLRNCVELDSRILAQLEFSVVERVDLTDRSIDRSRREIDRASTSLAVSDVTPLDGDDR